MAPRLNKRQQRELEELQALKAGHAPEHEDDVEEQSEEEVVVPKKVVTGSAFDAVSCDHVSRCELTLTFM